MKVLIADKFEDFGVRGLKEMGCEVLLTPELKDAALTKAIAAHHPVVLIVRSTVVNTEALAASPALKLVLRAGSGYNNIDTEAARQRGIKVANCPGTNSTAVAELTMGLILAIDRRLVDNANDLRKGVWNKKDYSKAEGLKGRTLGVVGAGQIGRLVARRALAFEMKILYYDVVPCEELDKHPAAKRAELDDLLRRSDIVTLHVPELPQTHGLMNAARLAMMKPAAVLINTCRGSVVDETALVTALKTGKLAFAGLDVYADEPTAAHGAFNAAIKDLPNVYGTHHIGASTEQAQLAVAELAVEIVREFKTSGKVMCCVNA